MYVIVWAMVTFFLIVEFHYSKHHLVFSLRVNIMCFNKEWKLSNGVFSQH